MTVQKQPNYWIPLEEVSADELKPGDIVLVLHYRSYSGPIYDFLSPVTGTVFHGCENLDYAGNPGRVGFWIMSTDYTYKEPRINTDDPRNTQVVYKIYRYNPRRDSGIFNQALELARRTLEATRPFTWFEK